MIQTFLRFIDALGNSDDGVESKISDEAHRELCQLTKELFGQEAFDTIKRFAVDHTDESIGYAEVTGDEIREVIKKGL